MSFASIYNFIFGKVAAGARQLNVRLDRMCSGPAIPRIKITMGGQVAVLAVAEKGSFEAAGKYLGVEKFSVRKRVRIVNSELGTPVFRFAGKGMVPTDAQNCAEFEFGCNCVAAGSSDIFGEVPVFAGNTPSVKVMRPHFESTIRKNG